MPTEPCIKRDNWSGRYAVDTARPTCRADATIFCDSLALESIAREISVRSAVNIARIETLDGNAVLSIPVINAEG